MHTKLVELQQPAILYYHPKIQQPSHQAHQVFFSNLAAGSKAIMDKGASLLGLLARFFFDVSVIFLLLLSMY